MKKILFLFMLMASFSVYAKEYKMEEVDCYFSANGGRIICKDKEDALIDGTLEIVSKIPNFESKELEILEVKGKQNFVKGKAEGKFAFYYSSNKQLFQEGVYENGAKEGTFKTYNQQGQLIREENYKNGIYDGNFASYDKNGKKIEEAVFKNGRMISSGYESWDGGKVQYNENEKVEYFKNGSLKGKHTKDGISKTYFENGKVRTEQEFKDGMPVGNKKVYFVDGSLKGEIVYKNGLPERSYQEKLATEDTEVNMDGKSLICEKNMEIRPHDTYVFCRDKKDNPFSGKLVSAGNRTTITFYFKDGFFDKMVAEMPNSNKQINYADRGHVFRVDNYREGTFYESTFYMPEVTYSVKKDQNGNFEWKTMGHGGLTRPNPKDEIISQGEAFDFPKKGTILVAQEKSDKPGWCDMIVQAQDGNNWYIIQKNCLHFKSGDKVIFMRGSYDAFDNLSVVQGE
ncbi:MAG: toxin-antitoxin system YwqK family antitoxin [Alphaproteobacteria bacterium]|nr:toxin-antitoxin system YwqK family antitoxin [Alphaproteobacteria bacterium]